MSGDQVRFDAPLPDLWDDEHAASLDDPGLLLYRSNLLGSDLRITNFGGGNTSAKLSAADPLTGAATKVLWVKGSGGDIGSMKLDGFSTLYMDKLNSLNPSIVALSTRTRWSRSTIIARSTSILAPLPSTPRCMASFRIACRSCSRGCGHCHCGERKRRSAHERDLWRGAWLFALAATGLRPRAQAWRDGRSQSEHEGRRPRRPRAVHLGSDLEGVLSTHARHDQQGRPMAWRKDAGQPSAARVSRRCRERTGAMSRRSSCPPFANIFPRASARSATSLTRRRCWSS